MREETLNKICFAGSVAGILFIYFVSLMISYPQTQIGDISKESIGKKVSISGRIISFQKHKNGHIFLSLNDGTGSIKIVLWKSVVDELARKGLSEENIKEGKEINVEGEVETYMNELEVIPSSSRVKLL